MAVQGLGLENEVDPVLLPRLANDFFAGKDWMLITSDDSMPNEHGALIASLDVTIATT